MGGGDFFNRPEDVFNDLLFARDIYSPGLTGLLVDICTGATAPLSLLPLSEITK